MLIARVALTVGNLERLAALTPQLTSMGCATRLVLAGEVAELCVRGTHEALDRAAELLRQQPLSACILVGVHDLADHHLD